MLVLCELSNPIIIALKLAEHLPPPAASPTRANSAGGELSPCDDANPGADHEHGDNLSQVRLDNANHTSQNNNYSTKRRRPHARFARNN
jgi:hypothetical protein